MRRLLSSLCVSLGLLAASLALFAGVVQIVLGDTGRPARVLAALVASPDGRIAIADAIVRAADSAHATTPAQDGVLRTSVARALASPALRHDLEVAAADPAHADPTASLQKALRAALRAQSPTLARHLGAVPLPVRLPGTSPAFGPLRDLLQRVLVPAATLALLLLAAAFVIARRRSVVLSRVGRWGVGASLVEVGVCYLVPHYLLPSASSPYLRALGVVITASSATLLPLFIALLLVGVALLVAARVLATLESSIARPSSYRPPRRPGPPSNPALPVMAPATASERAAAGVRPSPLGRFRRPTPLEMAVPARGHSRALTSGSAPAEVPAAFPAAPASPPATPPASLSASLARPPSRHWDLVAHIARLATPDPLPRRVPPQL